MDVVVWYWRHTIVSSGFFKLFLWRFLQQKTCSSWTFMLPSYEDLLQPISGQCSHLIPLENTRKPLVFWWFQGVLNGNIGQKWVKCNQCLMTGLSCLFENDTEKKCCNIPIWPTFLELPLSSPILTLNFKEVFKIMLDTEIIVLDICLPKHTLNSSR